MADRWEVRYDRGCRLEADMCALGILLRLANHMIVGKAQMEDSTVA